MRFNRTPMTPDKIVAHLSASPALRGLPRARLKRLAAGARVRRLRAGEMFQRQGERVRDVSFLVEGLVVASVDLPSGRTSAIEVFRAGDVAGCMCSLAEAPAPYDTRAVSAAVVILVPAERVFEALDGQPELCRGLLLNAAGRFGRLIRLRVLMSERSAVRVCGVLLWLGEQGGPRVPMTQATIAALAGLSLETVSRALAALKAKGWIDYTRGRIVILKPDLLRRRLEGR